MITWSNCDVLPHCFGQEQYNPLNENKCIDFIPRPKCKCSWSDSCEHNKQKRLKKAKVRNLQYSFSEQENSESTPGAGNLCRLCRDRPGEKPRHPARAAPRFGELRLQVICLSDLSEQGIRAVFGSIYYHCRTLNKVTANGGKCRSVWW